MIICTFILEFVYYVKINYYSQIIKFMFLNYNQAK